MRRQITAVRMSGGEQLHHIAGCAFVFADGKTIDGDTAPVASIITDIVGRRHSYFTRDWRGDVADVAVVGTGPAAYIRTKPDATMADNLLRLPRYNF
jgi:hypothetical protein